MKPESPRLLLCISLDHDFPDAADSLSHFQISLIVPGCYTCRAPSTIDVTLPDYPLVGIAKNKLGVKFFVVHRMKFSGGFRHRSAQAMGKVGRVNALIGPAAHSIGYTKCHVVRFPCRADEESILAAIWAPCENGLLRGNLALSIESIDTLLRIEATSFSRVRCRDSVREGRGRSRRSRRS